MYRQNNAHRCYPYSHQRVKQILRDDYHYDLQPLWGYKSNRIPPYVTKYRLVNMDTGETLLEFVTLNAIRIQLTKEGYPLKEKVKPNKKAIEFLEFVEELKEKNHSQE